MYNNCSIVKIICNVPFPWFVQASIQLHYRTPQSQSQFSQLNLSKFQMQSEHQF